MTTQETLPKTEPIQFSQHIWKIVLLTIILAQCSVGLLYVFLVPLWMPSDERAHMRYIMDLATTGHLHIMHVGDPSYETHQPPLFYIIGAVIYTLMPTVGLTEKGFILRIFCLALYVCSTFFVADMSRRHLQRQPFLAIAAVTFFALNPCLLAVNATISNDALSFLLSILTAWGISRHRFTIPNRRTAIALGLVIGLGMFCKLTQFPVLLVVLMYTMTTNHIRMGQKLLLILWELAPTVFLLTPWLFWNHSVYGTWTATSRLYGMSAAYAQHPYPARTLHDFNVDSILAYHYLPTEFWLNQFKVAAPIKIELIGLTLLSGIGLSLLLPRTNLLQSEYKNLLVFCFVFYLCHLLIFIALDIMFTIGPVRWIFGCFFAFSFLWCAGIDAMAQSIMKRNTTLIALAASLFFTISTNCYLLIGQLQKLQGYGLHP